MTPEAIRTEHCLALGAMTREQRDACDRLVRASFRAAAAGGQVEAHLREIFEQDARRATSHAG